MRHVESLRKPWGALALITVISLCSTSARGADDAPAPDTSNKSKEFGTPRKDSGSARKDADGEGTARVDAGGTFIDSIPIELPSFRKITPTLDLTYRSTGGNGWLGVGWSLKRVPRIERASLGGGSPRYDATDIYRVDGEELVPCATGSVSPSCTSGGTHSTKTESYLKIELSGSGASSTWTITDKQGTKSVYGPVFSLVGTDGTLGTADDQVFRWGVKQAIDTTNNVVTYNWGVHQFGGLWDYLDSINYNGTTIKLYYEQRPDIEVAAAGGGALERVYGRIKTVDITVGGSRLRSYKLSYVTSGATSRSLLSSVQQFGKDATLDASGTVTGGSSLPAITAGYPTATAPAFVGGTVDSGMDYYANGDRLLALDINGDGKTDMVEIQRSCLIVCSPYTAKAWVSNGTGFTNISSSTLTNLPELNSLSQLHAMDVNGDGKDDLVVLTRNGGGLLPDRSKWKRSIFLSNGTGFTVGATDLSMKYEVDTVTESSSSSGTSGSSSSSTTYNRSHFLPMDINGDGKTDMLEIYRKRDCMIICGAWNYSRVAWISTGSAFTKASENSTMAYDIDTKFLPMDFNGDGKWEFVELKQGPWSSLEIRAHLSDGTAFTAVPSIPTSTYKETSKFFPVDVNGDGKTDLLEFLPELVGFSRKIWLSTGNGWSLASTYSLTGMGNILPGDVNGDGRVDYVALKSIAFGLSVERTVYLSTGDGYVASTVDHIGNQSDHQYFSGDVDGDGRTDVIELYGFLGRTYRKPWKVGGATPDLLTVLGNGLGGTTTVSYTPSSAFANTNNPPVMQTATAVTVTDGRGGASTTTYTYSGGSFSAPERRSLGFAYKKVTEPCISGETACPYNEMWFRQDYGAAGKPSRLDQRDGTGKLLRSQVYEYTTNGATVPWTALTSGSWVYTYAGTGAACPGADCKRSYTARTFNAYGEVTQEVDYGDYDVSGDEATTTTAYVPNTAKYIVSLPADVKRFQGVGTTGTLLNESVSHYDGATAWNVAPSTGLPTKIARWLSSPSSFVETKYEYDAWGNVTAGVNALGARTTSTFDTTYHLFPISETNPLAQVTSTTWDATCGRPTQTTDLNGQTTTVSYDPLCRVTQTTKPGGKFEKHTWVSLGSPTEQYELVERPPANGASSSWKSRRYFDGRGRTWRTVSSGPSAATGDIYVDSTYNARGELASATTPYYWVSGASTTYTTMYGYDALDRVTRVTFPDGAQKTTSYGLWSTTSTDELGRAKTDRYDARGQRIAHDETIGGVTKTSTFAYDARGALKQSVDPAGNTNSYTTDSLGRRTSMVDPDWGTWTYEYDGAHRMTAHTDPKAQRTSFAYDALGRKTSKTSRAGTAQAISVDWTYDESRPGYYNVGSLTTVTDGAGTKTLDYDAAGRVVRNARTIDGTTYTFQHGFDAGDRPLWTTYPDGDTLGTIATPIQYDSAGRLVSLPGYVSSVVYSADGQVSQLNGANGAVTTRTISPQRSWISAIKTVAGTATVQDLTYTRNAKGLITRVQSPIANDGWTYTYDELDRLTAATNATSSIHDQALSYDAIGNITSNSRSGTYTYGTRPHAVLTAGSSSYTYDSAGLMTSGPDRTMTWDGDNRLASVTNAGITTTFTYDADGERIQQVEGATNRRYLGDDYEITNLGSVTKYISVAGSLVARKEGSAITWIHTDHLGSIQAQTNGSGAVVYRKQYRPYGETLSTTGSLDESRGYTGQREDASGLVYLHARYYDPALGRFISPDLIIDGSDTVGLNRHAYVGNNPINATDPTGLAAKKDKKDPVEEALRALESVVREAESVVREVEAVVREVIAQVVHHAPADVDRSRHDKGKSESRSKGSADSLEKAPSKGVAPPPPPDLKRAAPPPGAQAKGPRDTDASSKAPRGVGRTPVGAKEICLAVMCTLMIGLNGGDGGDMSRLGGEGNRIVQLD